LEHAVLRLSIIVFTIGLCLVLALRLLALFLRSIKLLVPGHALQMPRKRIPVIALAFLLVILFRKGEIAANDRFC
jgi:hypothetical protein